VKCLIILLLLASIVAVLSAESHGLYFDIGGGIGTATNNFLITKERKDNYNAETIPKETHYVPQSSGLGFEVDTRLGYGPFSYPLFLLGEVTLQRSNPFEEMTALNNNTLKTTTELNQLFAGPGIAFYPTQDFQVATSVGAVYTNLKLKKTEPNIDNTELETKKYSVFGLGYGFNLSAALDLGSQTYTAGLILGAKFSYTNTPNITFKEYSSDYTDTMKYSPATTYVGIFLKYRSRE